MKYLFLTILFSILSNLLDGQSIQPGLRIGISNSAPISILNYGDNKDKAVQNNKVNFWGGATCNFQFSYNFSFQTEVVLINKGYKSSPSSNFSFNLWHLEFPQYLRFTLSNKKHPASLIFVEGGIYFAWLFAASPDYNPYPTSLSLKESYTNTEYGVGFGGGYQHEFEFGRLELNCRYELSVSNAANYNVQVLGFPDSKGNFLYRVLLVSTQYSIDVEKIKLLFK